ncbi:Gp49 family protein [Alicycliphilus denitrificans]|uniref:Gp49 family protein n=1 Tax=Alicycliphilus denitrificans TaxID=179636 RepID=UPI0027E4695E|nr:Gp49 family protein [Alicycliphilus denitrificans]
MTNPIIKPTVGRRVWFRPSAEFLASNPTLTQFNPDQPMDAGIVYVHHDHMVNLIVTDHVGKTIQVPSVPLLAGQHEPAEDGDVYCCCEWMPYQNGQAAKAEAAEKISAEAQPAYRQRTQREELEYTLVSGAASHLALNPRGAASMATGIKTMLDALHPCEATPDPRALERQFQLAPTALPVIDPGPDFLEREIQAKASTGPRVTPADIEAEIACEHHFTAGQALEALGHPVHASMSLLTFCVLVLRNGFTVTGESACASPENFNAEIGRRIARENAVNKVWPLLGFRLRDKLAGQDA